MESGDGGRPHATVTLHDYWSVLRRRSPYVVAGLLLGLFLGSAYLVITPPEYTTAAEVLVRAIRQQPFEATGPGIDRELSMVTEREIASSGGVAERAVEILAADDSPQALLRQVQVDLPTGSQVLRFVFRADSADAAEDGANAFAQAYLEQRESRILDEVQSVIAGLDDRVAQLGQEQATTQAAAAAATDPAQRSAYGLQVVQLGTQISTLREQRNTLVTMDTRPGQVTQVAVAPRRPASPSRSLALGAGAAVGILLGLIAGLLREVTDDRARDAADVANRLGSPVLAELPAQAKRTRLVDLPPDAPASGAYALLALRAIQPGQWNRSNVLMVTSARPRDGKSHVGANIAIASALGHRRVLLVSTTGAIPDELAGEERRAASTDLLASGLTGAVRFELPELPDAGGVWFVGLGDDGWLNPSLTEAVLAAARAHFDLVIVDVRAALSYPDTSLIAPLTDATIVVVREATSRTELEELARLLGESRAVVAGAVINHARSRGRTGSAPTAPSGTTVPGRRGQRGAVPARVPR